MEKIIKLYAPILANEVSTNVHTLQRALYILGYEVEQGERILQQAGKSTQQCVRDLQQKMKVPANKKVLVDEPTAELINRQVAEKGQLQREVLFRVTGHTVAPDGTPVVGQRLSAFSIDVRGAGAAKTVQSVSNLKKESGFVFLEATESNRSGVYAIKFPWGPIRNSKRKRADIIVFATDGDAITGRSRIISTGDYEDTIDARNVDLVVVQQKAAPTEYEALMSALGAVLQENKLTLQGLFDADEQIAFIAREIEMDASKIQIAVEAERINTGQKQKLAHDLLYGLGRQEINLNWPALYRKKTHHLAAAIENAIKAKIIPVQTKQAIDQFLAEVHKLVTLFMLGYKANGQDKSVDTILSYALPDKKQRTAFVAAARQYRGKPEGFWQEYLPNDPAFKNSPEIIKKIQLTNQLTLLTGNHFPLVEELQTKKNITAPVELLEWRDEDWKSVLKKSGVPQHIAGADEGEKAGRYAAQMRNMLHAAYPTPKVALMLKKKELRIKDANIGEGVQTFFADNPGFHIGRSRVHDFDQEIRYAAPEHYEKVKDELLRMQRMFNLSPSPSVMSKLMELGFYSANTIAGIPAKNFVNRFGEDLGGANVAAGVHQRAAFISARGEYLLSNMWDISHGAYPELAFSKRDREAATAILQNHVANYTNLFGSPDICECEHCRSVYSPAAYFVDLMQFLWRSMPQNGVKLALDVFKERRPDLFHLPLTCENTNTVIPYIDLANEVMEFYTAYDELNEQAAYDTGDATAEELRANPQNVNTEAYKILAAAQIDAHGRIAVYPFNLPYHQPLDMIRICSRQLQTSRFELMQAFRNEDAPEVVQAIEAESLSISPEEYRIFTGTFFANGQDELHRYFGYSHAAELENMAAVPEFLRRSGMQYTELVELVKTRFINPDQDTQNFLTLYQPDSLCELDTTFLRTIENVNAGNPASGIDSITWSKIHRFIRLWRKLGWSIHELDLVLIALGEQDITPQAISKLSAFVLLKQQTNLPADQLAVFWGKIDTYGPKSLYKRLFLNKSIQKIDEAFSADQEGNYLTSDEALGNHFQALCAAFRITEQDLKVILSSANLDATNGLNLQNVSIIYRYVILSKALGLSVKDSCLLIQLFNAAPFSTWQPNQATFTDIAPAATLDFYKLADEVKKSGFKPETLQYILSGTLPAESTLGLDDDKIKQTVRAIRESLSSIENEFPAMPGTPFTVDMLRDKLSFKFDLAIVSELTGILDESVSYFSMADPNLDTIIPDPLSKKYSYVKSSGRLNCKGVMTEAERDTLQALDGESIGEAVAVLYAMPEDFIRNNFNGVFGGETEDAIAFLLNRPAQDPPATPEEKSRYVYGFYLPLLKQKLREDAVVKNIAPLIGLSELSTSLLIKVDLSWLLESLPQGGYSGSYFNPDTPDTILLARIAPEINFSWADDAPDPLVSADNFGVRWESYLLPPSSDDYTFIVEVTEADETFDLYLDDILLGTKPAGDQRLSLEFSAGSLQGGKMYRLRLEYHESGGQAGIQLSWQRPATVRSIVPMESAYPAGVIRQFTEEYVKKYHRAAQFITGFVLSEQEVKHFLTYNADFDGIDFHTLLPVHWKRIYAYTCLRNAIPQAQAKLIDLFAAANKIAPNPEAVDIQFQSILALLYQATAWDATNLQYLIRDHFELASSDYFKNEVKLNTLLDTMRLISRTGMSAQTLAAWAAPETSFDHLNGIAQQAKKAVKAKYEEKDWLQIARNMSDTLRGHQQQALISHLLTKPELQTWGVYDADGLFEYFLIDVQMGACMDTSRIVQANASIQLFVTRCLLNKEPDVSPDAIDAARWEWMKNYRMWEANRKVLLYPENWLDPEWRDNKSEFFKELESELVQNDITDRTVETALRNYLSKMNEVSNLDVCGMYQDMDTKTIHVFARTHHVPYQYFYRTCDQYWKWSAWEKVPIDIRGVEDGDNSGVHLIPVVWKKRLILFWPEFMEKSEPVSTDSNYSQLAEEAIGQNIPAKYWEIRLAWSENVDGKWMPKQVTNDFITTEALASNYKPFTCRFYPKIWNQLNRLQIQLDRRLLSGENIFSFSDIYANVKVGEIEPILVRSRDYDIHFMKFQKTGELSYVESIYLNYINEYKVLFSDFESDLNFVRRFNFPFFYQDSNRTYFVKQVTTNILDQFVGPDGQDPNIGIGEFELGSPENPVFNEGYAIPENAGNGFAPFGGAPAYGALKVIQQHSPRGEMINSRHLEMPFANSAQFAGQGLEFHTFYHPYSDKFSSNLNQYGLNGLMNCDLFVKEENGNESIPDDHGDTFRDAYIPSFDDGLVRHLSLYPSDRTLYKENVCFDVYGANSIYNWELFFHAPLYIATRLSKNGKHAEAMRWFHYIFDPTTDESPQNGHEMARFWKVLPFRKVQEEGPEQIEEWLRQLAPNPDPNPDKENDVIKEWRNNPFRPHLVAGNRPTAYMRYVVLKYVENLIAWGDQLFRKDTMESINEALQIYVIANHILGPRPQFVPKRGEIKAETYVSLKPKLDDFSNALVQMENIFPYSSEAPVADGDFGGNLLGFATAFYFCIPSNDKLLGYWDTVADRLFKIRHCMNIEGVERRLALFEPPIDPGMLIKAAAHGLSLGEILSDLSSPPPIYRFTYLLQKAIEFCAEVKSLGTALLSALEKKDGEVLALMRATQETSMLGMITAVKNRQVSEAKANKENLLKTRDTAASRLLYNAVTLLGNDNVVIPPAPEIENEVNKDTVLPETAIAGIQSDVDVSLVDSDERSVKLINKEKSEFDAIKEANYHQNVAGYIESGSGAVLALIPNFGAHGTPLGVGGKVELGGTHLSNAASAVSKFYQIKAAIRSSRATDSAKYASYIRREQDWTLQANLAGKEIIQIDKQIVAADIRRQSAEKELDNHHQQIVHAQAVEDFLKGSVGPGNTSRKFSTQENYQWMSEQIFSVYKQSYNLAFDLAKKAEIAYRQETGEQNTSFIQYGYWADNYHGLMAGEQLHFALRQMEKSYLEENKRELELTKHLSLATWNPLALLDLKETGRCYLGIPEEWFDLDFQGHYFRRIKSVRMSIPCVIGPYTSVNCTLRLLKNTIRTNTALNNAYAQNMEEDDLRFRSNHVQVKSIATSSGQNDSGMFELNFRDERYLPFEGAGVISEWMIEMISDPNLRQFDYSTISDIILHLNYTAREDSGSFKTAATEHINSFLSDAAAQPLTRLFSLRHEFPEKWRLMQQGNGLEVALDISTFPYLAQKRVPDIQELFLITDGMMTNAENETVLENIGNLKQFELLPVIQIGQSFTVTFENPANIKEAYLLVRYILG